MRNTSGGRASTRIEQQWLQPLLQSNIGGFGSISIAVASSSVALWNFAMLCARACEAGDRRKLPPMIFLCFSIIFRESICRLQHLEKNALTPPTRAAL